MAISVVMPALELAQETGKVLVWIKKEGDKVVKGEPLLEIETDKVSFEMEAQADGRLAGCWRAFVGRRAMWCRSGRSSRRWWRRASNLPPIRAVATAVWPNRRVR